MLKDTSADGASWGRAYSVVRPFCLAGAFGDRELCTLQASVPTTAAAVAEGLSGRVGEAPPSR